MNKTCSVILFFLLLSCMTSCMSVKEYQKMYLNDEDMQSGISKIESFEQGMHTYREGVSGANGGKTGGGCGCN